MGGGGEREGEGDEWEEREGGEWGGVGGRVRVRWENIAGSVGLR